MTEDSGSTEPVTMAGSIAPNFHEGSRSEYLAQALEPHEDDSLMDELLASNPQFQALVAKSKAGPRKPYSLKQPG